MTKPFRLPLRKRIFTNAWFQNIATWLIALGLKICWLTFRVTRDVHPNAQLYMEGKEAAIFCFWHGRMIVFPCTRPHDKKMHVLISHHRDGELIAKVIGNFGISSIRGSSSKGAKEATREMIAKLNDGDNVSITPDGPRGPAQKAEKGAVMLAKMSGKSIIPVSFSASCAKRLNSWDSFMIPLPFSRIVIQVGEPLYVNPKANKSQLLAQCDMLENQLNHLTEQADKKVA